MRLPFIIRWAAPMLAAIYLVLRASFSEPLLVNEVIVYNLIPVATLISIISTPILKEVVTSSALVLAITAWWIGSALSSYLQFIRPISGGEEYIDVFYLLFYPPLLWALHRIYSQNRGITRTELSDLFFLGTIIFFALSILLRHNFEASTSLPGFSIVIFYLYLFFDVVLIMWAARILIIEGVSLRNNLLAMGLLLFIVSDLAFIWISTINGYSIGELLDFGWLAGIILISLAIWSEESSPDSRRTIHPFTLISSLLISILLLTLLAINNDEVPSTLAFPAFLALLLATIRITVVLRKSHQLSDESYLAHIDELTGLANRRKIVAELSALGEEEGAFLLLDLDGFKPINDQYGHSMGDQLLIEIAERFTRALPESAVVARLGGDEFGVIVKGSYEDTLEGAYALRASLSYPFTISGQKISVGVSIGYVHNDGYGDLLKRADIAMYQAKNSAEGVVQS